MHRENISVDVCRSCHLKPQSFTEPILNKLLSTLVITNQHKQYDNATKLFFIPICHILIAQHVSAEHAFILLHNSHVCLLFIA